MPQPPYTSLGFLLDEETALKSLLTGYQVSDLNSPARNVTVYYSHPDREKREQQYPYAVLTLINISEAPERMHSGRLQASVIPGTVAIPAAGHAYTTDWPIPVNLFYQVSAYSRNPKHDRGIIAQFANFGMPFKGGVLDVADGTLRRMDLVDFNHQETDEGNRRLFVSSWTVRISSEMTPSNWELVQQVQTVTPTLDVYNPFHLPL